MHSRLCPPFAGACVFGPARCDAVRHSGPRRIRVDSHADRAFRGLSCRGLALGDAVVDEWGVESRGVEGKTVWFEVAQVAESADLADHG
ncbi:hypothetical protein CGZ69_10480 [Streptomyces peucetius subsp. caesius ATCC 27952]|nr:hypothetical protein CGZ69_10480 [Streptomyces peucetius subsp. caesius ATCC 27952]